MLAGTRLAQGVLAGLVQRAKIGRGCLVEVNLMESTLDFQFEVLATHLNHGGQLPRRAAHGNAHAYLGAPYGIYQAADGYIALAMGSLTELGDPIALDVLTDFDRQSADAFERRDEAMAVISAHLRSASTSSWLAILEPAGFWCADVYDCATMLAHEGYAALGMEQEVHRSNGASVRTLRCPIRTDGRRLYSDVAAPSSEARTKK